MDKNINVNKIFGLTVEGIAIMEKLKHNTEITDKLLTKITHILCDCLFVVSGGRASTTHKDLLAKSLVETYPSLSSAASDNAQSLWFHKHGRGIGKHAGKLHYRLEFLSKKAEKRLFVRESGNKPLNVSNLEPVQILDELPSAEDMLTELQYSIPNDQSKERLVAVWKATIAYRNEQRTAGTFSEFLKDFPVASAFNGELLAEDFAMLKPKADNFDITWNNLQPKVIACFDEMFLHISDPFLRSLAIIRVKNPTRGARQSRDNSQKTNPLHKIIDWIDPEAAFPVCENPQIFVAAENFKSGDCYLIWKDVVISTGQDLKHTFILLCKGFTVFNTQPLPSDKLFFSFFSAAMLKIMPFSTTANKFLMMLPK
ncbi:uncharacterized protein LOC128745320 [Sabethes cyaneus]|uniref:uncharacterized protein LOC128745320 n=1 Tax=Sabethes cyaneus TaxID=53552 RepID=UPI00237E0F22|nr:uncharacterized protein LOC128745320 [Sabethes cyaneus]